MPRPPRRLLALAVTAGVALTLAACTSEAAPSALAPAPSSPPASISAPSPTASATPTPSADPVVVVSSVRHDQEVPASTRLTVSARGATVTGVSVTGGDLPVTGDLTAGTWTQGSPLSPGVKYRVAVTMTGGDGGEVRRSFRFATSPSTPRLSIDVTPNDRQTVGVAQSVTLRFASPVGPRKAVLGRLHVQSDPQVVGAWAWVSDREVRWRPQEFWPAGTRGRVVADLRGMDLGGGMYAAGVIDQTFTIGRSQVVRINARSHQGTVTRDGAVIRRFPVSLGKPGFVTRSGVKVVMERYTVRRMTSTQVGESYDLDVPYALRLTWSGEFLHAAPWASSRLGRVNGSHGCTNVSMTDGKWFFRHLLQGDPVITKGTNRGMTVANGFGEWNASWASWAPAGGTVSELLPGATPAPSARSG